MSTLYSQAKKLKPHSVDLSVRHHVRPRQNRCFKCEKVPQQAICQKGVSGCNFTDAVNTTSFENMFVQYIHMYKLTMCASFLLNDASYQLLLEFFQRK